MRIAIYGLPSSGKTTLIEKIPNVRALCGRQELERLSGGEFSNMSEEDKRRIRIRYTEYLSELNDDVVVSDGHYSFVDNVVFTPNDGDIYDVIFYLYCNPAELKNRLAASEKNEKYSSLSEETIKQWQEFEIESLRAECHLRNKDFYVITDNNESTAFYHFFSEVVRGLSATDYAKSVATKICELYPATENEEIVLVDGDKTIIEQDSFRFCYDGKTKVFDGDHYTGYQSFLFSKELEDLGPIPDSIRDISLNEDVMNMLQGKRYVILSSGITSVWNKLKELWNFTEVIADPMISADTKYYIAKYIKTAGYRVTAIGDSKNDFYMLKEADIGYMQIGNRISRSLLNANLDGLKLLYDKTSFLLESKMDSDVTKDISICKSNSGINGNRLAAAHIRLGQKMGAQIASLFPARNTAVLVLDRGGRFFGDGVYSSFGGVFYPYNPSKEDVPEINQERIVIVDSVINSGKSILKLISDLKSNNPNREIVVVTNVIQREALTLFSDYKVFAVRASENSFVGKRQALQTGKSGPDTADRLFNIIDRGF